MGVRNKGMHRPIVTYYKSIQDLWPDGIYWNSGAQTSASTALSIFGEYSTSGLVAWKGVAAGDVIAGIGFPFYELDYKEPIEVSVVVTSSSAHTDAPVYKLGADAITFGSAIPTPMTTLSTFSAITMGGAGKPATLIWTCLAGGTFKRDTLYVWGLELHSLGAASTNELYTLGVTYRGKKNITGESNL
jgi:hypothetical protein